jgi:general secretion pathway protein D
MFFFVFSSPGCAGTDTRQKDNGVTPEVAVDDQAAGAEETAAANISPDEQGRSETVSTPFGDVKRTKQQTVKKSTVPVAEKGGLEEQEGYEIISTPFGYVKRKKQQPDKGSTVPVTGIQEVSVAPAPETAPASPAPVPAAEVPAADAVPTSASLPPPGEDAVPVIVVPEETTDNNLPEAPGRIRFDFDDAELDAVIRVMADFLKITYIIDPGVTGKVTIHTAGHLKESDVFPIFYQTLEVNGLTAVREGNVYRILKLKDASRMPIASRPAGSNRGIPPEERIVLQIIPLKFISAQEVSKVITPFVSPDGTIIAEGISNTLLVVDKGINIFKILKLVEAFDVSVFEKANYRFYTLQNADAEAVSKTLAEVAPLSPGGGKDEVKFIPIEWLNALLIVSSSADVFSRVDALISQLDIPSEGAQPQIYVYSVKNGMAVDLGETLRSIFGAAGEQVTSTQREVVPTNPFAKGLKDKEASRSETTEKQEAAEKPEATVRPAAAPVKSSSTASGPSATLRSDVRITDDQIRNALIIEAIPGDYRVIERILERLDVLPRQVLIDVVIAEVTLGEGMELGVEWTFKKGDWTDNGSLSASIGGAGLKYTMGLSHEWQAALSALANDSKLNIISSPTVLASDNKQAKIDVTTEVPIPSTNYTYVTDGDNVLETSVEYRDTGVILDVTPHINEYGLVTMDISQEVSNVGALIKVAGEDYYSFDTRKILTSLTVKHNQSIVIGGLISNQKKDAASGVPWLLKIPIIRWLTGTEKNEEKRSELIVMITPHVITSLEDVDAVSEEFKHKVEDVMTVFK